MTPSKPCSRCAEVKPLTDFHVRNRSHDGRTAICKRCVSVTRRTTPEMDWADRFLTHFKITESGCWEWTSNRGHYGHGTISVNNHPYLAHRISYALHYGDLPVDTFICHHCDNPPCVNPEHLYAGTAKTNVEDMVNRGRARAPRGEDNGAARLTTDLVRDARTRHANGESIRSLADEYGVSDKTLGQAIRRINWKHVA